MHLLLKCKHFKPHLLFFIKLSFLFSLTDIRLEIFKLILSGSLTFLIIIDRFRDRLHRCISDWDQNRFIILTLFFPSDLLLFLLYFFFELTDSNSILNYLLNIIFGFLVFFFISKAILRVEKSSPNIGLD